MPSEENLETPPPPAQTDDPTSTVFVEEDINFAELYDQSLTNFKAHQIVKGKVIDIGKDFATVDIGYKSEGQIPIEEFLDENREFTVEIGDEVEVFLEALEDSDGMVILSKEKAEKLKIWDEVGKIYESEGEVEGMITSRIKGGLTVDIGIKAFLPGSQVDLRPVRNLDKLIGERFQFKILKYNQRRGNIVLSRRALLEIDREARRKKTLEILKEGVLIKGFVKNITEYGVFIDLGGVDGLLHITDMTWGRIVHPSQMFAIGDEVEVMVLKFDAKEEKVSLGLKQKQANPWDSVPEKYPKGTRIEGRIVSLTDYGAFIELEEGVEGLIHVSEMSWTRKIRNPSKFLTVNQTVEAVVKDLDVERKRISLSMKEAEPNPWKTIEERFPDGLPGVGKVRNITDFGIFVGLEEGIDGLVHISDLSWSQRQRKPSAFAKKGDDIQVKILHIDPDKERLSMGIKQLSDDPWKNLEDKVQISSEVQGRVVNVTDFGIFVEVLDGVEGLVHISEIDQDIPKENIENVYPVGTLIRAKVIKIDVDERRLGLTILGLIEPPPSDTAEDETLEAQDESAETSPDSAGDASAEEASAASDSGDAEASDTAADSGGGDEPAEEAAAAPGSGDAEARDRAADSGAGDAPA
ncbi:MAG: 30S ribosomal protein S1, partial [SAR324 cluster bacterium]|nr:30S ribosomal protein S1 [SAR324 cluster bacterium]